jgi:predicted metal-dependent phosphoesterase TrpH
MRRINTDVHLHTCLSPCAEITQSPKRVVEKAYESGLNMLFITDHNTIANAESAIKAAKKFEDFMVYPGMEITSREEVHTLSLFENLNDAGKLQDIINEYLPDVYFEKEKNEQIIANEFDEVEGFYGKSLFSAVDLGLEEIIELIHRCNGIAIAAHIDRQSFSVISQLGMIPEDCNYDALEISPNMQYEEAICFYKEYAEKFRFVKGSDSHSLNTIGNAFTKYIGENNYESFLKYLKKYSAV